ncbi:MAG: L-threonylcarbamoyladenylate synthase [Candidatus Latescibacterota bacterium]
MSQKATIQINNAASVLKNGGIIIYPTETVYGIGCDPLNADAVDRTMKLKQRDSSKTMLLLAESLEMVEAMAGTSDILAHTLAEHFWPGPLTMIIKPSKPVPEYLKGSTGGVAFRVTSHRLASAIIREFGRPIISTSANITGQKPIVTYESAYREFGSKADLVVDNTEPLSEKPSTIIDITSGRVVIVRPGGIGLVELQEISGDVPAQ